MASTKPPTTTPPPYQVEETTGQHVRVQLADLSGKLDQQTAEFKSEMTRQGARLDEAIKVDRDDHVAMRMENTSNHTKVTTELGEVKTMVKGAYVTLDVIANTLNLTGRVEAAKKEAEINDDTDRRARRREIGYGVLKALAIVIATWLLAHYTGIH